jgi:hypothetical protein
MNKIYQGTTGHLLSFYTRAAFFIVLFLSPFYLFTNPEAGIPVFLFSLSLTTAHAGVIIDFEKRVFKSYLRVMGVAFGKWQPIPVYNRITVVRTKDSIKAYSRTSQGYEYTVSNYTVRLYDEGSWDYQEVSKGKLSKVKNDAELLSKLTAIDFEDFTVDE